MLSHAGVDRTAFLLERKKNNTLNEKCLLVHLFLLASTPPLFVATGTVVTAAAATAAATASNVFHAPSHLGKQRDVHKH